MNNKKVTLLLIILAVISRLLPHSPNFTAVGALAITGPVFAAPLALFFSDLFLGFHPISIWVYGSFILISLVSRRFRHTHIVYRSLTASLLFYFITNLGVFLTSGLYVHNLSGLIRCYTLALPFFKNTILSDLFFSPILTSILSLSLPKNYRYQTTSRNCPKGRSNIIHFLHASLPF